MDTVVTDTETEIVTGIAVDKFDVIAGRPVKVMASDVVPGRQRRYYAPAQTNVPKDDGPEVNTGTHTNADGLTDQSGTDQFWYCYMCKDAWEIDDDFVDLACPYCGQSDICIIEMDVDGDVYDTTPFFHS